MLILHIPVLSIQLRHRIVLLAYIIYICSMKSQRSAVKAEVNKTWQHHFTDKEMDNCKACAKERKVVCQYIPLSLKLFFRRERTITTQTSLVRLGQRRSVCFHFKVLLMASLESSV